MTTNIRPIITIKYIMLGMITAGTAGTVGMTTIITEALRNFFLKSLPLGIIIMLLSPIHGFKLPFQFTFPYYDIVVAILSTILIIYGGRPFYQGSVDEFKQKNLE